jgi:mono/diheme cytochrome c family protein
MLEKKKQLQLDKETIIIIGVVCLAFLWTVDRIFSAKNFTQESDAKQKIEKIKPTGNPEKKKEVKKAIVPLATGKEPIDKIFVQSGCAACHTIPGILSARGREGPKLELGTNARKRLGNANYQGRARTEWEYVQESILNPGAYIVEGYRDHVMPRWYGQKLSAQALDKIIKYLLKIEEVK